MREFLLKISFFKNRDTEALTVIEIIVATVILALVISALYRMLLGSVQHTTSGTKKLGELQDVSLLLQRLNSEIKNADSIIAPRGEKTSRLIFTRTVPRNKSREFFQEEICYELLSGRDSRGGTVIRKDSTGQNIEFGRGIFASDGFEVLPLVSPQGARGVLIRLKTIGESGKQLSMEIASFPRDLRIGNARESIWQPVPTQGIKKPETL